MFKTVKIVDSALNYNIIKLELFAAWEGTMYPKDRMPIEWADELNDQERFVKAGYLRLFGTNALMTVRRVFTEADSSFSITINVNGRPIYTDRNAKGVPQKPRLYDRKMVRFPWRMFQKKVREAGG
jgi:hypothetical protein